MKKKNAKAGKFRANLATLLKDSTLKGDATYFVNLSILQDSLFFIRNLL